MLGKFLFNQLTPYNRSYIHITLNNNRVCMLPAINTAVFFLTNGDRITINNLDYMNKLPFLDYQLIEADKRFKEEMENFRQYVKDRLYQNNFADIQVFNKQIINDDVYIVLEETEFEREQNQNQNKEIE